MATLDSPTARSLRRGLLASLALHASLFGVLLADAAWPFRRLFSPPTFSVPNQVVLQARTGPPSAEPLDAEAASPMPEAADNRLTSAEAERHPDHVFGQRALAGVEKAAAAAQDKSAAENIEQLQELAGQLGRVSSDKTVDEMAHKFRHWLGTGKRAEQPSDKPVEGEFDFGTAQLHDVRREQTPDASYAYFAILVDAAGRRYESPMDPLEGESTYKTMQLVKANPLLEKVYRGIVMGVLDNLIKTEAHAAKPQAETAP